MGMSTIADAVNEGGVTDITLDKNDGDGFEQKDDPLEQIQNIKERNDQSVQTAIRTPTWSAWVYCIDANYTLATIHPIKNH